MTRKLFESDSYIKEFKATVIDCVEKNGNYGIILDATAFFYEGGGQACDIGTIGNAQIFDVQIIDDEIWHFSSTPLEKGKEYDCSIDWERRFRNMQNHSGEHIISGLIHKHYGFSNVGFHLGKDEVTMDIDGVLTRAQLNEIELLANEAIVKNATFSVIFPSKQELKGLEYRSKLDLDENVRIVNIKGYDSCACCAPHVSSASQIGVIKILDFFKMRKGIRIYIKCGFDAIKDYEERYLNVKKISDLLSAKQNEVFIATEKMLSSIGELKYNITELKKRIIDEKISAFKPTKSITAVFTFDMDIKEMQIFADGLKSAYCGVRAVFSKIKDGYNFAICGEASSVDTVFASFKSKFQVKGGGRNGLVQGSVEAERQDIEDFFNRL